jgi:hypothetical protein
MAHTMMSFEFEGGDCLCFSIEARKEKGEGYSAVKGLFRQFELVYIAADERDLIRLRTNYRQGEEAYLFRLNGFALPGARIVSRLPAPDEQPAATTRVVQRAHPQLHDQHPHAARRGGPRAVGLANAGERLR